jgi:hypothetical protein
MMSDRLMRRPLDLSSLIMAASASWTCQLMWLSLHCSASTQQATKQERKRSAHLDILPLVLWHLVGEATRLVDRARRDLVVSDDAMGNGDAVIVLTERRRLVDDTGTGRVGDISVGEDSECAVLILSSKRQHWFGSCN